MNKAIQEGSKSWYNWWIAITIQDIIMNTLLNPPSLKSNTKGDEE